MQGCVVDTHTLIWHAFKPRRLGHAARAVMESVDGGRARVFVPAIVVSEFLMVAEKGRIDGLDLLAARTLLQQLVESQNYVLTSLTPQLVIASADHPAVPDIFDRLIVTEALRRDLPLVTRAQKIHESGLVETVWD